MKMKKKRDRIHVVLPKENSISLFLCLIYGHLHRVTYQRTQLFRSHRHKRRNWKKWRIWEKL